jgi:hypothetical protein
MIYLVRNTRTGKIVDRYTSQQAALDMACHLSELGDNHAIYEGNTATAKWVVYDGEIYELKTTKK